MRCGNIRIHVEIPIYADKNNCFCDDNHVSYSIPAIRKACETASNLPIIQYDEQGTEKVVGVAQSIKWNPHGFIEVDGQLLFGGTEMIASFQWNLAQSDLDERGRIHDFDDEQRRNAGVQQTVQQVL